VRTLFHTVDDLDAALPSLLAPDGSCFIPAAEPRVEPGERVALLFTVVDGSAGVRRPGVVLKALYDGGGPAGRSGFTVQVLPPDDDNPESAALPLPVPPAARAGPDAVVPANPLSGLDSHMVALFIEFNLTEHIRPSTPLDEVPSASSEALRIPDSLGSDASPPPPRPATGARGDRSDRGGAEAARASARPPPPSPAKPPVAPERTGRRLPGPARAAAVALAAGAIAVAAWFVLSALR
jgi:hypothetical protein